MLGYTESDLNKMINAVHDAKLFYLRTPSDLMDKTELRADLEMAVSFMQGLWAEGYFDHEQRRGQMCPLLGVFRCPWNLYLSVLYGKILQSTNKGVLL